MKKDYKTKAEGQTQINTIENFREFSRKYIEEKIRENTLKFAFNIMIQEVESLCGAMHKHKRKAGFAHRGGSDQGSIALGGQKIPVTKPRVRKGQKELRLKSYETLHKTDLQDHVFNAMLGGLSERKFKNTLEDVPGGFGVSKSTLSRHFIEATKDSLEEINTRRFEQQTFWGVFIDGISIGSNMVLVALGVDSGGNKHFLGISQGSNEDSLTVSELLTSILERCRFSTRILAIIDGSKAIKKALRERFGENVEIQRCYIHKLRNIESKLPKKYHADFKNKYRTAFDLNGYADAKPEMLKVLDWLKKINLNAAESLEEGFDDLLTIHRIEMPPEMRKSFYTTNVIESGFANPRHQLNRVKRWDQRSDMIKRFAAATMLEQEKSFRKVRGYKCIPEFLMKFDSNKK